MATEQEAKLRLTAQDETARAFQSVQNNLRKTMREVDSGARETKQSFREGAVAVDAFSSSLTRMVGAGALAEFARRSFTAFAGFERGLTRIEVMSGATRDKIKGLAPIFEDLSTKFGVTTKDIADGFEMMLRSSKLTVDEAAKLFPTIVEGAHAAQVSTAEMAATVGDLMRSFKVDYTETNVKKVVDDLAKAGQLGHSSIKELVAELPHLATQFSQLGISSYKGEDGIAALLANLLLMRESTGNTSTAAEELIRIVTSGSPMMVQALRQARQSGEDVFKVLARNLKAYGALADTATGRNVLEHLFPGTRNIKSIRDYLAGLDEVDGKTRAIKDSAGAAKAASDKFTEDSQGALDKLAQAWDRLLVAQGKYIHALGGKTATELLSDLMAGVANAQSGIAEAIDHLRKFGFKGPDIKTGPLGRLLSPPQAPVAPEKAAAELIDLRQKLIDAERRHDAAEAVKPEAEGGIQSAKAHALVDELKARIQRLEAALKVQQEKPATPSIKPEAPRAYEPPASTRDLITKTGFTPETARDERNLWERILLEMNGARTARMQYANDVLGGAPGLMNASYQPGGGGGYGGGPGGGGGQSPAGPGGGGLGNVPPMGGDPAHAGEAAPGSNPRADHPMAPAGAPVSGNLVTVTSKGGAKFRVNPEIAENVQGFINDYEARGGVIGPNSGGAGTRGNPSRHPAGDAFDINQIARGMRKGGKSLPTEVENELIDKWGGGSGARFRGGKGHDSGHFEFPSYAAARAARERNKGAEAAGKPSEGEAGAPSAKTPGETGATAGRPPTADAEPTAPPIIGGASTYNPARGGDSGGTRTASGEQYNPNDYTAAIQSDLESKFFGGKKMGYGKNYKPRYGLVEHNGKKVIVRINDRGPLYARQGSGRVIDLNERTMREFDPSMKKGVLPGVKVTPLPEGNYKVGPVKPAEADVASERPRPEAPPAAARPEPDTWSDIGKGGGGGDTLDRHRQMREEMERPIKMNIEAPALPSQLVPNFRRASARESLSRETRDARWLSYNDIGAA